MPVNFLQADWNFLDKKMKKKIFPKIRAPAKGIEPWPLSSQSGVYAIRLWGIHEDKCLKMLTYTNFQNFKGLVGNLQAS